MAAVAARSLVDGRMDLTGGAGPRRVALPRLLVAGGLRRDRGLRRHRRLWREGRRRRRGTGLGARRGRLADAEGDRHSLLRMAEPDLAARGHHDTPDPPATVVGAVRAAEILEDPLVPLEAEFGVGA